MNERNPEATCATCPYCGTVSVGDWLECRRRAPLPVFYDQGAGMYRGGFTPVLAGDWCEEHPDFWKED